MTWTAYLRGVLAFSVVGVLFLYLLMRLQGVLPGSTVNTQYKLILSGATNLSADNRKLVESVRAAKAEVVQENSSADPRVNPADAVTSSGSGLDPDISPRYAALQVHRVAARNHLSLVTEVRRLVDRHTEGRTLGFMGDPRVNVLALDIALRELVAKH